MAKMYDRRFVKQLAEAGEQCHAFNSRHSVGVPVIYRPIRDLYEDAIATKTRSEAWVLPSGHAGGVSLDHLEVRDASQEDNHDKPASPSTDPAGGGG